MDNKTKNTLARLAVYAVIGATLRIAEKTTISKVDKKYPTPAVASE